MLYDKLSAVRENKYIKLINTFLYSPYYMLLVALLMAASNVLAIEFFVCYIYAAFTVYIVLCAPDTFPLVPIFCCAYMLFSANNNPTANYGDNFLSTTSGKIKLIAVIVIIAISVVIRLAFALLVNKSYRNIKPALTLGFLILGVSYIIGGIFTEYYSFRTAFFGFAQILSLCATYYFFYLTIDFSKRKTTDIAFLFTAIGIGVMIEVIGMYLNPGVLDSIKNGTFKRDFLISGWGVYNNVGAMMAMMIPAPFYLAVKHKFHRVWLTVAGAFMLATVFSQSRGAMLSGGIVFLVCLVLTLVYSKGKDRLYNGIFILCGAVLVIAAALTFFRDSLLSIFSILTNIDFFYGSNRNEYYIFGFESYLESPIFGNGFYVGEGILYQHGTEKIPNGGFLPPRFHNTVVQLLASGGAAALFAYYFHRVQTIWLVIKEVTPFKLFFAASIVEILLASLVDCHFFNFGPGVFYGVMLLFIEKIQSAEEERQPKLEIKA